MANGIASHLARGAATRRLIPMPPEDLLEAAMIVFLVRFALPKSGKIKVAVRGRQGA